MLQASPSRNVRIKGPALGRHVPRLDVEAVSSTPGLHDGPDVRYHIDVRHIEDR